MQGQDGHCIWYDECGFKDSGSNKELNCVYNGPPKPFKTQQGLDVFRQYCPDLYKGNFPITFVSFSSIVIFSSDKAGHPTSYKLFRTFKFVFTKYGAVQVTVLIPIV